MLNNSEIEKKLKEDGIVKAVIGDYVIYKRDWLYDHIEQERTLINSVKDFRNSKPQMMDGITRLKQFIEKQESGK